MASHKGVLMIEFCGFLMYIWFSLSAIPHIGIPQYSFCDDDDNDDDNDAAAAAAAAVAAAADGDDDDEV